LSKGRKPENNERPDMTSSTPIFATEIGYGLPLSAHLSADQVEIRFAGLAKEAFALSLISERGAGE
jgi:hypothetical protein